jgi:hypothetical protein
LPDYSGTKCQNGINNIPNNPKIFQMAKKHTKWPSNLPNGHQMYQMAIKCTKWPSNITNGNQIHIPKSFNERPS